MLQDVCKKLRIQFWPFAFVALCFASLATPATSEETDPSGKGTYNKHIAPLLWKNCAGCHRPGEVGPFSLLTYKDAAKRADHIAEITRERKMPPWKAEPNFGKFHDERRLTEAEIALLASWAKAGAPEGEAKDLPEPPKFPEGWQLGEPDLIVKMSEPFVVPASGRDIYRCFVIPVPVDRSRMVRGVEFRAGNRKVVHHAILYLDSNGQARKKDGADGKPGYVTFGGPGIIPTGGLGIWVPGAMPRFLPEGMAKFLQGDSDLVLQVHYHPIGKEETDQSQVGIYFSKTPVRKIVTGIAVMDPKLRIPAGNNHVEANAESDVLPVAVKVLGVGPHMHNLGREFKVTAKVPKVAEEVPLVWIKDWDFNWQGSYQFAEPVQLPKGSVIKVHAVFDNSAGNPKNPNSPPKDVKWGEQTTDEMLLCGVQVFTEKLSDLKLVAAMRGNEGGAGLDGGIPGQSELVKRKIAIRRRFGKFDVEESEAEAESRLASKKSGESAQAAWRLPDNAGPYPIPELYKDNLGALDTNNDGKLSREEIEKVPPETQKSLVKLLSAGAAKDPGK